MPQDFHIGDILSITTARLLSPRGMDGIYDILNYMSGDNLFTHQLPRVCDECKPALLRQYPRLAEAALEATAVTAANLAAFLARWVDRYGETLPVAPLPHGQHEYIDPVSELAERRHPTGIVVVSADCDPDAGFDQADRP